MNMQKQWLKYILNQLFSAFSGIGDALGKAISGGNFGKSLFDNLTQSFGDGLVAFGKQMILASKYY